MTRRWIVADMDSTLLRKELGVNGDLDNSPCRAPLFEWLQQGGSVCVVTSDDGFRPFTQMWEQIPAELRADGRVAISTSDGAALFRGGPAGEVVEDVAYWEAGAGITSWGVLQDTFRDKKRGVSRAKVRSHTGAACPLWALAFAHSHVLWNLVSSCSPQSGQKEDVLSP